LDPLSGEEFRAVASILQREHGVVAGAGGPATSNLGWRFASIELAEPGKTELRAFDDGGPPPPRRAEVICLQRSNNATYKSLVSLTSTRAGTGRRHALSHRVVPAVLRGRALGMVT